MKNETLFSRIVKHPFSWALLVIPAVVAFLFILYGNSLASSSLASFVSIIGALVIYFLALRVAMYLKFLSQHSYVEKVKEDPRALSCLISSVVIGVAIVVHGSF